MEKKDKASAVAFCGEALRTERKLSFKEIAKRCGNEEKMYRIVYAFFKGNEGRAMVDTAARIAIAMGVGLNDLYVPVDPPKVWPTAATPGGSEADLQIVFSLLTKEERSRLAIDLYKKGHEALGELCNKCAIAESTAISAESESEQNG